MQVLRLKEFSLGDVSLASVRRRLRPRRIVKIGDGLPIENVASEKKRWALGWDAFFLETTVYDSRWGDSEGEKRRTLGAVLLWGNCSW